MWRPGAILALVPTVALAAMAPSPGLAPPLKGAQLSGLLGEVNFLINNTASFWMEHGLDRQDGGFYGTISRNGSSIDPTGKGFTAEARYLWGFTTLYEQNLVPRQQAKEICDNLYAFLVKYFRDPSDNLYWMRVARDGARMLTKSTADEEPNVLYSGVKKWMYGQSFATLALARYGLAFNRSDAIQAALDNFASWDAKYHDPVYGGYDQTKEDGLYIDFKDKKPVGTPQEDVAKTTNVQMHLMSAISELYLATGNATAADRLYELIVMYSDHIIQPQGYGNQYFTRDWKAIGNFDLATGHDLESAQLLLEAADTLKDTKYAANATRLARDAAVRMTKLTLKYGYDYQHGGWYNGVNMTDETPPHIQDIDEDHIWWVQAESLPALYQLYKLTGDEALMRKMVGTLDWIKTNQVDQVYGEVYWGVWPDGQPDARGTNKGEFWKANYHITHGLVKLRELLMADPAMGAANA